MDTEVVGAGGEDRRVRARRGGGERSAGGVGGGSVWIRLVDAAGVGGSLD